MSGFFHKKYNILGKKNLSIEALDHILASTQLRHLWTMYTVIKGERKDLFIFFWCYSSAYSFDVERCVIFQKIISQLDPDIRLNIKSGYLSNSLLDCYTYGCGSGWHGSTEKKTGSGWNVKKTLIRFFYGSRIGIRIPVISIRR